MKRRLLFFVLLAACIDPVHDEQVEALGPEVAGVEEGEFHRPGQPCVTCHGEHGPGEPEFSVAGTVYLTRDGDAPAEKAIVTISDGVHPPYTLETNAVGNFYVEKKKYDPVYPLTVHVKRTPDAKLFPMRSLVRRAGDCGNCHRGRGDDTHVPHIYASEGP
jgi:hypothetical protein